MKFGPSSSSEDRHGYGPAKSPIDRGDPDGTKSAVVALQQVGAKRPFFAVKERK
jgi:hypothetical protein